MDQFKQRNLENESIREKSMTFDLFKQKMDRTIFQDDYGFSEYLKDKIIFNTDTPNIESLNILMIAEKPSIAMKITEAISGKNLVKKKNCINKFSVYEFKGFFNKIKANFTVTHLLGHVFNTAYNIKFHRFLLNEYEDLFDLEIIKRLQSPNLHIDQHLIKCAEEKDIVCLWLDNDNEGENICFEALYFLYSYMNKRDFRQIYRAKFSSTTDEDLISAFNNLTEFPNYKLSLSVDADKLSISK